MLGWRRSKSTAQVGIIDKADCVLGWRGRGDWAGPSQVVSFFFLLEQAGRISWDAPVSTYLPELETHPYAGLDTDITIRDLLSHSPELAAVPWAIGGKLALFYRFLVCRGGAQEGRNNQ